MKLTTSRWRTVHRWWISCELEDANGCYSHGRHLGEAYDDGQKAEEFNKKDDEQSAGASICNAIGDDAAGGQIMPLLITLDEVDTSE